jgi:hypothetical protein
MLMLPRFLDNRRTGGGEVSLTRRPRFTSQGIFLILISIWGWVNPRAIVRPKGLDTLTKKSSGLIGIRTCDLPACNIAPQLAVLPRALPCVIISSEKINRTSWIRSERQLRFTKLLAVFCHPKCYDWGFANFCGERALEICNKRH